jgi:hypothetical protein
MRANLSVHATKEGGMIAARGAAIKEKAGGGRRQGRL